MTADAKRHAWRAIVLFGVDATNGPLQVALILSAAFASLIAFKNGYSVASVGEAAVKFFGEKLGVAPAAK